MIIEATASDFEALRKGLAPRNLRLVSDSPIAPPDVLEMLSKLADEIRPIVRAVGLADRRRG